MSLRSKSVSDLCSWYKVSLYFTQGQAEISDNQQIKVKSFSGNNLSNYYINMISQINTNWVTEWHAEGFWRRSLRNYISKKIQESRTGSKDKLTYHEIASGASSDIMGSSGAGMALLRCPTTMQGNQLFAFHGVLPLASVILSDGTKLWLRQFLGLDDSSRKGCRYELPVSDIPSSWEVDAYFLKSRSGSCVTGHTTDGTVFLLILGCISLSVSGNLLFPYLVVCI